MTRSAIAPPRGPVRQTRKPISRASLEIVISRAVAGGGLLFGAQTLPTAIAQRDLFGGDWWVVIAGTLYGLLLIAIVSSLTGFGVRVVNSAIAFAYLASLALWIPASLEGAESIGSDRPWLWLLMTVATAAAAVAFSFWLATVYLLLAPLLYLAVRLTVWGGEATLGAAALDAVFAVLLGGAVLIIITMLRSAADSVDAAQATALSRYVDAVREHAIEVERVKVDAIVHDSVLTSFLSAAKAQTPEEKRLAATLAANAMRHLTDAVSTIPDDQQPVSAAVITERILEARETLAVSFTVNTTATSSMTVPAFAAEAIIAAAIQAMVNSAQHAGEAASRWITVEDSTVEGLVIEIGDDGVGFDLDEIPLERLGVRFSIIERMVSAGGLAEVAAARDGGARVRLEWPDPLS